MKGECPLCKSPNQNGEQSGLGFCWNKDCKVIKYEVR